MSDMKLPQNNQVLKMDILSIKPQRAICIIAVLATSLITTVSQAADPKYSNEFLSLGVGARQMAMGSANTATTSDVFSTYWNPAGLTELKSDMQIGAMHNEYFAGLSKHDYLGAAFRMSDSTTFALSMIRFGVDDIPNTLDLYDEQGNIRYDRIKSFSAVDYAFVGSLARKSSLLPGLQFGANLKIIRRIIGEFGSAWGFGADLSAQYRYKNLKLGIMARDITTTFNAWSYNTEEFSQVFAATGNEIPVNSTEVTLPKFIFGIAYKFPIYKQVSGLFEADFDMSTDGRRNVLIKGDPFSVDPHAGLELAYKDIIFIRGGIMNMQRVPDYGKDRFDFQPNIGAGVRIKRLTIDYALTDIGDNSIALYSNVFSLTYAIDKRKD